MWFVYLDESKDSNKLCVRALGSGSGVMGRMQSPPRVHNRTAFVTGCLIAWRVPTRFAFRLTAAPALLQPDLFRPDSPKLEWRQLSTEARGKARLMARMVHERQRVRPDNSQRGLRPLGHHRLDRLAKLGELRQRITEIPRHQG